MKVLVLGSSGQLGQCLYNLLYDSLNQVIFTSRSQLNIINLDKTREYILSNNPDVIINATAYTSVDLAEDEYEMADLVNNIAVSNIAEICQELGCWLIHISTDYVFDGSSNIAYKEIDETNPKGVYGQTKLRGEQSIKFSKCKYIILRTSWLFSENGNNFLKTMIRLGSERETITVVGDQTGCPTYAPNLAMAIVEIVTNLVGAKHVSGVFHYCGNTQCSWFEFALEIFSVAKIYGFKVPKEIISISSSEFKTRAHRPMYSALDNSKIYNIFGINSSDMRSSLEIALLKIKNLG